MGRGPWTSDDFWSYWKTSKDKAARFLQRARSHQATHTASGKPKKPCLKCEDAKARGFMGCDYYWDQISKYEEHSGHASSHRQHAREMEIEEGKPLTVDGKKTQEQYNQEWKEEIARRWAAEAEEEMNDDQAKEARKSPP